MRAFFFQVEHGKLPTNEEHVYETVDEPQISNHDSNAYGVKQASISHKQQPQLYMSMTAVKEDQKRHQPQGGADENQTSQRIPGQQSTTVFGRDTTVNEQQPHHQTHQRIQHNNDREDMDFQLSDSCSQSKSKIGFNSSEHLLTATPLIYALLCPFN